MPFEKGNTLAKRSNKKASKLKKMSAFNLGRKLQGDLEDVYHRLMYWMRDEDPQVSLSAIKIILDRAIGKPKESIEFSGEGGGPVRLQFEVKMKEISTQTIELNGDRSLIRALPKATNGSH